MSKTVEDIGTLKINLLSQAQYEAEVAGGTIEPNELYLTPSSGSGVADVEVNGESVVSGGVAEITINDIPSGGTTGQVLTKDSGTDYDVSWEDPSGGTITDVEVDGTSVVTGGVAEIDLTGKADVSHTHTKSQITDFPTIPTITDTYSSSSSNGMSGKAVKQAIDALDGTISGSAGAGKTLTALSQTDGKVSATFSNISITKSQVSDFPAIPTKVSDLTNDSGFVTTDTKNTAGSTQSTSKLYLIGATSQGANPQTYSNNWLYYDNGLYSKGESGDYISIIKNTYNSAQIYSSHYNNEASIDFTPNDIEIAVDGVTTDTSIYLDDDKVEIRGNNGEEYITVTQDGKVTIDGVVAPSTNSMAVNKKYVDDLIPTVNNATLTIQKNSTNVATFTANASSNVTANISVPTNTSDLNNDSGFITGVTSTSTPTASTIAEFDSTAHMNSTDMSSADVTAFVNSLAFQGNGLLDFIYPVGSYYETSDTTFNPNITWGGTWVLETEGQVHVSGSANGTYQVSGAPTDTNDGGASTVTLQTTQIPSHNHPIQGGLFYYTWGNSKIINSSIASMTTSTSGAHFYNAEASTSATGGGQAHENMPPYIVVNRWHRTA